MGLDDNGPMLVGVTWGLTFLCGGFLGLRIYAKLSRRQRLWWDDHILITAWVILLAQAIITQITQKLGAGKHQKDIPVENLAIITRNLSIGASVSCFASTFSKISFGVTLLRLTEGPMRWITWFCIVTLFIVMLPSALLQWFSCMPTAKVWDASIEGTCWDKNVIIYYGIFNAAWCVMADFALALMPWSLIWGLQMRLQEKIGVGIAMSMGLLAGVCAIIKGIFLMQLQEKDFFYNGKDVVIWTVVETATAIVAASIPVLRVFVKEKASSMSTSRGRSQQDTNKSVPLSRLSNNERSRHSVSVSVLGPGKDREGAWIRIEPIDEERGASRGSEAVAGEGNNWRTRDLA